MSPGRCRVATLPSIDGAPDPLPDPPSATEPAAPLPPADAAVEGEPLISALQREMEVLRDQLEQAFDETAGRFNRVEIRLGTLRQQIEAQTGGATSSDALTARIIELLLGLTDRVDAAPSPSSTSGAAADLAPLNEHLVQLRQALTDQLIDTRMRIESGIQMLRDEVTSTRVDPVAVDTRALEDAADRGALRNAADMANLRRNIEALAEVVRAQDKGITDLATTLDWIKERLLLR